MSDWFCVSAWYENGETEVHYEIANEDGEQAFFWMAASVLNKEIVREGESALDRFYYAEEDLVALGVTILDEEMIEHVESIEITQFLFRRYYK